MAQYFTDFSDDSTGSEPQGWSTRYDSSAGDMTVETDAAAPGGKSVVFSQSSYQLHHALAWDDVGTASDTEIVIEGSVGSSASSYDILGVGLRASGSQGNESYYYARLSFEFTSDLSLYRFVDGADGTQLGGVSKSVSYGDEYYVRFRASGSTLNVRAWESGTAEPGGWDISVTDSTLSSGETLVVAYSSNSSDKKWYRVGVGTGGDSAPTVATSGSVLTTSNGVLQTDSGGSVDTE